jgi:acrylyl-CoA reductase (NADPH)
MSRSVRAIVADKDASGAFSARLTELAESELGGAGVLVDVAYSTVNYKDGLAVTGRAPICQKLPLVCGIDLAGRVAESSDPRWQCGDRVLVNGYGLSERHGGGYAQRQRVDASFLVRIPEPLTPELAMAIGTAGYTAMLAVNAIRDHGVKPGAGPVLVTGAAGGVGSVSVLLLAKLGYEVVASTGRPETEAYLKSLGAHSVVTRASLARAAKPLEKETWAAVVDSVGSSTLATALAQTKYDGVVAACGLAGGADLPGTVMPFLLRNVRLQGIDSVMAPMPLRERAWRDLAQLVDVAALKATYTIEPLARVPALCAAILRGEIRGRVVIDVNA